MDTQRTGVSITVTPVLQGLWTYISYVQNVNSCVNVQDVPCIM